MDIKQRRELRSEIDLLNRMVDPEPLTSLARFIWVVIDEDEVGVETVEQAVARLVGEAPPLSPTQKAEIRRFFGGPAASPGLDNPGGPCPLPPRRTAVYRFRDSAGTLLYVGVAYDPEVRAHAHSKSQRWWPEVAHREIEWYEDRTTALEAERVAIGSERPLYNVVHAVS